MFKFLIRLIERRRIRARAVEMVSREFWKIIAKNNYTIAIAGNRRAIKSLSAHGDREHLERATRHISLLGVLAPWPRRRFPKDVDFVVVTHQGLKRYLAKRLEDRFPKSPVFVLYDCVLAGELTQNALRNRDVEMASLPRKTYVIASSHRTGSSMLCDMLTQLSLFGYPRDYIQNGYTVLGTKKVIDAESMLINAMKLNQTENGVFGIRTHWSALEHFEASVLPFFQKQAGDIVRDLYRQSPYIHLTRRNKIHQAISRWRANETQVSHVTDDGNILIEDPEANPPYRYDEVRHHLRKVIAEDFHWRQFFHSRDVCPLKVVYEEMVDDPRGTIRRIAEHLGIELYDFEVIPRSKRLSDGQAEQIHERFVRDLSAEFGDELIGRIAGKHCPEKRHSQKQVAARPPDPRHVLATLATHDFVDRAKQLFSSAYFNAGWNGDYLLLAHDIPEPSLKWFRERGILVRHCTPLFDGNPGGMHACLADKFYLFTDYFKQWDTVIYSDVDIIIRGPLDDLKQVSGFCAVEDWSPTLYEQIVSDTDIQIRGLDVAACKDTITDADRRYRLSKRPFCAGFFAFSTGLIKEDTFDELKNTLDKYRHISKFGDQLSMNFYFYDRWNKLSPMYDVLVRQEKIDDGNSPSEEATTRWGIIQPLDAYILHIFNPKPWNATSFFHLEWLANLERAESLDLSNIPKPREGARERIKIAEQRIRVWQRVHRGLDLFGSNKTKVIDILQFAYWRYIFLKRTGLLMLNGIQHLFYLASRQMVRTRMEKRVPRV